MTLKQARAIVRLKNFYLTKTKYDEYRLVPIGEGEASAYYTPDLDDAVATALYPKGWVSSKE